MMHLHLTRTSFPNNLSTKRVIGIAPLCPKDKKDIKPGGGVAAALLGKDRLQWCLVLSLGHAGGKGRAMVLEFMVD